MRDFAVAGAEFAQNHIRADVDADCLVTLGLIKLVENIGEAATRLSPETQAACPQIPWRQIIAARHRLVHGYDRINYDVLWRILAEELPKLREQLDAVISTLGQAGT
ncbi:DUF86 domain-containing protein [Candidatus Poribacteria bacterium]|nr:DUF86 domain-containing protein [Candidatus Poribacteria bacterium]